MRHAICARDWARAADLIEQAYAFFWVSEHALVRRWLEKIPTKVVRSRPRLCLAYAKILFLVAPHAPIERWLHDAETAVRAMVPTRAHGTPEMGALSPSEQQERDNLLGEIAAYRAVITAFNLGDGQATLAFCHEALAHLSEQNLVARAEVAYAQSLASYALGESVAAIQSAKEATVLAQATGNRSSIIVSMSSMANSLLSHGKLHEVVQLVQQAALLGTTLAGLPDAMLCWVYIYHADVLREWNRLDEALDIVLQAIQLSEQTETTVALYLAQTVLMRIYLARGERDAARLSFQQAEAALAKTPSPYRCDVYLIDDWVQFWLANGKVEHAIRWVRGLAERNSVPSPLARERRDVARARILLVQMRPTESLSLMEPLQVRAEQQERWGHVLEMKVLQARAYQMRRQEEEALSALAQAVRLAEPEGYLRCFVDEGASMAALLSRLREQERKHGQTLYLDTVLGHFASMSQVLSISLKGRDSP